MKEIRSELDLGERENTLLTDATGGKILASEQRQKNFKGLTLQTTMIFAILTEVQFQRFFVFSTRWRQVIDLMSRPI